MCFENTKKKTEYMTACDICPRQCMINRDGGMRGYCGETSKVRVARAALHMWEEPCISRTRGSGTVFFTGCPLKCVFCQNSIIANNNAGVDVSIERLAEIFLDLQNKGANNINLITATHFIPQTAAALELAKKHGLVIPVVYNTGGYERKESLKILERLVDVYLPDMKYFSEDISSKYSNAKDYFSVVKEAIDEMFMQVKSPVFASDKDDIEEGIMKKGVIVRHLLLPGQLEDSKKVVKYLYDTYGDEIYISIMNQYTPMKGVEDKYPELGRRVSEKEYDKLVDYAIMLGVENGFIQEGETAKDSFILSFNGEGLL